MAEIRNYTMKFGSGRSLRSLNLRCKLAFAEIHSLGSNAVVLQTGAI